MTTRSRKLRGAWPIVFAPPAAEDHPLKIAQFRAWRVKEPVSNRRYTVVRLQSQAGIAGYGEGGPAPAAEIVAARAAVMDRRATESEYIRAALRGAPALEAAVNNAMLDLVSRAKKRTDLPVSGRTGPVQGPSARSSGRCNRRRIRAVTRARESSGDSGLHYRRSHPRRYDSTSRLR